MLHLSVFVFSLGLGLLVTPLVGVLASALGAIDRPAPPRKLHTAPTPLLGGVAVFVAFTVVALFLVRVGLVGDGVVTPLQVALVILGAAVLVLGGWLDDWYGLRPLVQFVFPLTAAVMVVSAGVSIGVVSHPLGGIIVVPAAVGVLVTTVWILGMTYTTKFLDGLDGLVAGITAIGACIIALVSLYWDMPSSGTALLALALAGACAGFLPHNWNPARIFLGEGGSLVCGYLLAVLAVLSGSKIATLLLVMVIPVLDVAVVLARRLLSGRSLVQADRAHLHFQLLDLGLTQRQAVLAFYVLAAVFGISSLVLGTKGKIAALVVLCGMIGIGVWFGLKRQHQQPKQDNL